MYPLHPLLGGARGCWHPLISRIEAWPHLIREGQGVPGAGEEKGREKRARGGGGAGKGRGRAWGRGEGRGARKKGKRGRKEAFSFKFLSSWTPWPSVRGAGACPP